MLASTYGATAASGVGRIHVGIRLLYELHTVGTGGGCRLDVSRIGTHKIEALTPDLVQTVDYRCKHLHMCGHIPSGA